MTEGEDGMTEERALERRKGDGNDGKGALE